MTTGPVLSEPAAEAAIGAACQVLHLPTVGAQAVELADQAARDRLTHRAYLAELLSAETDTRDTRDARRRDRRVKEAKFPRVKRLADFDLSAAPGVAAATLAALASGTWIDHGTPLVLLGDSGTGKSHLLIGVAVAACEQGRAVRYATCAALVNELVEAADERTLAKTIGRYARLDLLCCAVLRRARLPAPGPTRRRAAVPGHDRT
jgi:DNA replication protein DnaC